VRVRLPPPLVPESIMVAALVPLSTIASNPKNWVDVLAHALGETYALWSVKSHAEDVQKLKRKITKSKRRRK